MGYEGADPEKLRVAAGQMDSVANTLESSAKNVHSTVTNAGAWWGSDGDQFRTQWTNVSKPNIAAAVATLRQGATSLQRNAAEQDRVSSRAGGAGPVPASSYQEQKAPEGAAGLFQRVNNANKQGDGMHIDKVVGPDGKTRLIAYFQGQDSTSNRSGVDGFVRDGKLLGGWVDQQEVQQIKEALASSPDGKNTQIMLVGLSQGGMDAQNIAAQSNALGLNVTNVVTYGSPISVPDTHGVQTVHLQATSASISVPVVGNVSIPDVVPGAGELVQGAAIGGLLDGPTGSAAGGALDLATNQAQPSVYNHQSTATPSVDHSAYYPSVAQDFDNANLKDSPQLQAARNSMTKFQGDIVDTTYY